MSSIYDVLFEFDGKIMWWWCRWLIMNSSLSSVVNDRCQSDCLSSKTELTVKDNWATHFPSLRAWVKPCIIPWRTQNRWRGSDLARRKFVRLLVCPKLHFPQELLEWKICFEKLSSFTKKSQNSLSEKNILDVCPHLFLMCRFALVHASLHGPIFCVREEQKSLQTASF